MLVFKTFAFCCAILAVCESRFVDSMSKCSIHDNACQGALVMSTLKAIHKTGIPELGIPPIDPLGVKDVSVSVADLFTLTALEAKVTGVKDCVVDSMETEIEKGYTEIKLTCNSFYIKAKYTVTGSSPLIKNLLGGDSVHGEGNGKVKIEKIKVKFNYFYDIKKNKDGDAYFHCKFNKTLYDYEIDGKVSFQADSIYLGETDATELVLGFINDNSRFVLAGFGKPFLDKAMEFVYMYSHKFFDVVPAKYFITEDLSQYIKA